METDFIAYANVIFSLILLLNGLMCATLAWLWYAGRNDTKDWERIATELETHLKMRK